MPRTLKAHAPKSQEPSFQELWQPVEKFRDDIPLLPSRGNRQLKMNFEQQLKSLILFHLEEYESSAPAAGSGAGRFCPCLHRPARRYWPEQLWRGPQHQGPGTTPLCLREASGSGHCHFTHGPFPIGRPGGH